MCTTGQHQGKVDIRFLLAMRTRSINNKGKHLLLPLVAISCQKDFFVAPCRVVVVHEKPLLSLESHTCRRRTNEAVKVPTSSKQNLAAEEKTGKRRVISWISYNPPRKNHLFEQCVSISFLGFYIAVE